MCVASHLIFRKVVHGCVWLVKSQLRSLEASREELQVLQVVMVWLAMQCARRVVVQLDEWWYDVVEVPGDVR